MDCTAGSCRSLVLLALFLAGAALPGCTSAGLCTRGEIGCACTAEGECEGRGRCDNGMCIAGDAPPDAGPSESDSGPPPDPAECVGDNLMAACQSFCEAFCQNQERFCVGSRCVADDCEPDGVIVELCLEECAPNASCAQRACETQSTYSCDDFTYRETAGSDRVESSCFEADPRCVIEPDNGCSDTCGTRMGDTGGDLADNGICEDGGEDAAEMTCKRGTDCSDCGVRVCLMPGDTCGDHEDCCGHFGDGAYCVETSAGAAQCLADCTQTRDCPDGQRCSRVEGDEIYVCVPM